MDRNQPRLTNILSNRQNSVTARFYSNENSSDYISKKILQQQKKMQLIEHVIFNRKDYYQTIKYQATIYNSLFTIKGTQQAKKRQVEITKPFISGINLKNYFIKLAQSQQTLSFAQLRALIAGLFDLFVRGGGCPYFIYTLENIIINDDQHLDINITSMTGFKFLVCKNEFIKQQQFRQINHYLDVNVFQRKDLNDKYSYQLMQTNFVVLLLNVIFQKQIVLVKLSTKLKNSQAKKFLLQIQSKWPRFLNLKAIYDKIDQFSSFIGEGANLTQLFNRVLIQEKYLSWGQIREMMFGRPRTQQYNDLEIYNKIVDQKWKSIQSNEKQFFIRRKLVEIETQNEQLTDRDKMLYLNIMLGLDFNSFQSQGQFKQFLKQQNKHTDNYHKFWYFCQKQYLLLTSTNTKPKIEQLPNYTCNQEEKKVISSEVKSQQKSAQRQKYKLMLDQKNNRISELYQIANNKLSLEHKGIVLQQQYLRSLRLFLRPLRQFFDTKVE